MEDKSYVFAHYESMCKYGNIFTLFEEELAKGNPEVVAIARDLEEGEVTIIEKNDVTYHRVGNYFVKTSEDYDSVKSLLATLTAKACGVACPNLWLVPIRLLHRLSVKEYENEKYVQVTSFYEDWQRFDLQEKVAPKEMGKQIAFNLFVGNGDQFGSLYNYLDPTTKVYLSKQSLERGFVNVDNLSVRGGRIHSVDLSMEETNTTRFLFREIQSEKMQSVLDWLAEYLSYNEEERKELEESYLDYSKKWVADRGIDHLWRLAQVYVNGFPFYYYK